MQDRSLKLRRLVLLSVREFFPEIGARGGASVEVFDTEVFVGAVQVVAVLAPAEEQRVNPEDLLETSYDGNGAAFAHHDRQAVE